MVETMDLAGLRAEYGRAGLDEGDLTPEPVELFERWLGDALDAGLHDPNAMVVATADEQGAPSARLVLLKELRTEGGEAGFVFFTNTGSRKGRELAANPRCALLFPWHALERQVRVDGVAAPLPAEDVAAYFATRPRGSKLGAWASRQSRVTTRAALAAAYEDAERRYPGEVPVPEEWGGYVVRAQEVEFWQGRPGRMHDRLRYVRADGGWRTERLAP